jgi:parallel beta-helix repeat protein
VSIKNNVIKTFCITKDDGGAIYTFVRNNPAELNSIISYNTIGNGIGVAAGTDSAGYLPAVGIYLDEGASFVHVTYNTVSNCAFAGIQVHLAHDNIISNNKLVNNAAQLNIGQDINSYGMLVRNNVFMSNTLHSDSNQWLIRSNSYSNDINLFATFVNNIYYKAINPANSISVYYKKNNQFISAVFPAGDDVLKQVQ